MQIARTSIKVNPIHIWSAALGD